MSYWAQAATSRSLKAACPALNCLFGHCRQRCKSKEPLPNNAQAGLVYGVPAFRIIWKSIQNPLQQERCELSAINRLIEADEGVRSESVTLFPVEIFRRRLGLRLGSDLGKVTVRAEPPMVTILFISPSAAQDNLEVDWTEAAESILRQCPLCQRDSIIGHGRRRKQAHDEDHDWIGIRRGLCNLCGKTFTFLPPFSPPYGHYSLIARSQALRRRFVEGCSWEMAAPSLKDPDRVADPSTLRRWFRSLDSSRPPFSSLRRTVHAVSQWLQGGGILHHGSLPLCWQTLFPFLQQYWPLRL